MKNLFYCDNKPDSKRFQEYSMHLHKTKLEKIKSLKLNINNSPGSDVVKIKKSKKISDSRNNDIYRENQILLCKLLSLSAERLKISKMRLENSQPKSMNTAQRKRTAKEILRTNKTIASRLASMSPSYNIKDFEKEYFQHANNRSKLLKSRCSYKATLKKVKNEAISQIPNRDFYFPRTFQQELKDSYNQEKVTDCSFKF